jgi:hypothetical protein
LVVALVTVPVICAANAPTETNKLKMNAAIRYLKFLAPR